MIKTSLILLSAKDNSYISKKDQKEKDYSIAVALYEGKVTNFSIKKDQVGQITEDVSKAGGSLPVDAEITLEQFQWQGKDINTFRLVSYTVSKTK